MNCVLGVMRGFEGHLDGRVCGRAVQLAPVALCTSRLSWCKTKAALRHPAPSTPLNTHAYRYVTTTAGPLQGLKLEVTMAQHLLAAADRYQLIRLRCICEQRLCDTVEVRPPSRHPVAAAAVAASTGAGLLGSLFKLAASIESRKDPSTLPAPPHPPPPHTHRPSPTPPPHPPTPPHTPRPPHPHTHSTLHPSYPHRSTPWPPPWRWPSKTTPASSSACASSLSASTCRR